MCVLCDSCKSYYDINNNSEKKKFCKKCYNKQYRIDNRESIKEQRKQWNIDNREKIKEQNKQWRIDNRVKIKEQKKQWRIDNREYIKQYNFDNRESIKQWNIDNREKMKQYRIDNAEKHKTYTKQWRINNHELIKEQKKQYYYDNPEKMTIQNWKRLGLIELEGVYTYESLYEYYLSISHCEVCETKFKNSFDKCMDHCHKTNIFRWVLCRNCNTQDNWMKYF